MLKDYEDQRDGVTFLAVRVAPGMRTGATVDAFMDLTTARMNASLRKAVALCGAWPGAVYAVWELNAGTPRSDALELALRATPDRAVIFTDLGVLFEAADVDSIRDLEPLTGD